MRRSNVVAGESPLPRPVVAEEQCDRCCAPACVYVVLPSGLDLVFCSHHARQYELLLRRTGAMLRRERALGPR
jgi:hypothetical protein